jgi:hypothetical protein
MKRRIEAIHHRTILKNGDFGFSGNKEVVWWMIAGSPAICRPTKLRQQCLVDADKLSPDTPSRTSITQNGF